MGIHILHDRHHGTAAMYCSTTDWAFGPVFSESEDGEHDAVERVEAFLRWLARCDTWGQYDRTPALGGRRRDARQLTDAGLERAYADWRAQEAEQRAREAAQETAEA